MSTILGAFSAARQSILVNQRSLAVTGQNIANVNTNGYSRQRARIHALPQMGGATVYAIERLRDGFLDKQRAIAKGALGLATARDEALSQLEMIVDETNALGPFGMLSDLFTKIQDLSLRPTGLPEREGLRSSAISLANGLHTMRRRLEELQQRQDDLVKEEIEKVNQITSQIAGINAAINRAGATDVGANEMLDRRMELVHQLSELVDARYYEDSDGLFTIVFAGGFSLVEGDHAASLKAEANPDNNGFANVVLRRTGDMTIDVTDRLATGRLAGLLNTRDEDVANQIQRFDKFAAQLAARFNVQHRAGYDLAGQTNIDFFRVVDVYGARRSDNQGDARITDAQVLDQAALTFDDYEIRFTAPDAYQIVNLTTQNTTSGTYASGAPIVFDGVSVTISGTVSDGDAFSVNTTHGAASAIALSAQVAADLSAIAASADGLQGDNGNALALAALETQGVFNQGTATFGHFLSANLTALGVAAQRARDDLETQEMIVAQVDGMIQSLSGVSLDEESTYLLQYERAFQAGARVIQTLDELLQTIISI